MDAPFATPPPPDDDRARDMPSAADGKGEAYLTAKLEAAAARAHARAATHPERRWPVDLPNPATPKAPAILREIKVRLQRYFHAPAEWLPRLNVANGSLRQQRSERREACVQLLRAFVKYCDLRTLRIGRPGGDTWVDFTFDYLAEQAGLSLRRAERALKDLKRAKLVTVRRQCELQEFESEVRYKGLAAITYLSPSLFDSFGLGRRLRIERNRAHLRAVRQANRQRKRDRKAAAQAAELVERIAEIASRPRSRGEADPAAVSAAQHDTELVRRASQLKVDHPDWDRETCYRIARQQLAPPS
uniref:Crp/Fnr family transcriptional regulator n=1 Tax=Burkholderia arboris TaxID=488730 RepID=UPI003BEF0C2C